MMIGKNWESECLGGLTGRMIYQHSAGRQAPRLSGGQCWGTGFQSTCRGSLSRGSWPCCRPDRCPWCSRTWNTWRLSWRFLITWSIYSVQHMMGLVCPVPCVPNSGGFKVVVLHPCGSIGPDFFWYGHVGLHHDNRTKWDWPELVRTEQVPLLCGFSSSPSLGTWPWVFIGKIDTAARGGNEPSIAQLSLGSSHDGSTQQPKKKKTCSIAK